MFWVMKMSNPADPEWREQEEEFIRNGLDILVSANIPDEGRNQVAEKVIQRAIGEEYKNIRIFAEGGTKLCFLAEYEGETRVIKIDKNPESANAIQVRQKGYNSAHDGRMRLGIPNSDDNNILRVLLFKEFGDFSILVEDYFDSETLEKRVKEKGPLNKDDFEKVFTGVLNASRHTSAQNVFHRDINPMNILVNDELETMVTDFTNACYKDHPSKGLHPTFGARNVLDPRVVSAEEAVYDEMSEVYELGASMFFSFVGNYFSRYDPFSEDGKLILADSELREKHNRNLESSLSRISVKYQNIIRKCLTLDEEERFKSVEELSAAFEEAKRPSFWQRARKYMLPAAAVLALTVGAVGTTVAGVLAFARGEAAESIASLIGESKILKVIAEQNGEDLEIVNNMAEMDFTILQRTEPGQPSKQIYPIASNKYNYDWKPFLEFNGGERISVWLGVNERPLPKDVSPPSLPGKVYFEGIPGDHKLFVYPGPQDRADYYAMEGSCGTSTADMEVPKDLPDGVYYLVGEFYAPIENDGNLGSRNIRFENPEKIVMRKRIPCIIGNPEYRISLSCIMMGIPEQFFMKSLGEERPKGVEYEISISGLGINSMQSRSLDRLSGTIPTPCTADIKDGLFDSSVLEGKEYFVAQITARHNGKFLGTHFFPIAPKWLGDTYLAWRLHVPGKEYQAKLEEMMAQTIKIKSPEEAP
jgi:hypothetical protein